MKGLDIGLLKTGSTATSFVLIFITIRLPTLNVSQGFRREEKVMLNLPPSAEAYAIVHNLFIITSPDPKLPLNVFFLCIFPTGLAASTLARPSTAASLTSAAAAGQGRRTTRTRTRSAGR